MSFKVCAPPGCPNWTLSAEAREIYNFPKPDFDADFSSGEEDPQKAKKKGGSQHKKQKRSHMGEVESEEAEAKRRKKGENDHDIVILYKRDPKNKKSVQSASPSSYEDSATRAKTS
ncbi:40130_t:CDS:2, partial [Gigaspora margarita]